MWSALLLVVSLVMIMQLLFRMPAHLHALIAYQSLLTTNLPRFFWQYICNLDYYDYDYRNVDGVEHKHNGSMVIKSAKVPKDRIKKAQPPQKRPHKKHSS